MARTLNALHRMPLRIRLVAVVVVILAGALCVTGIVTNALLSRYLQDEIDKDLEQATVPIAQQAYRDISAPVDIDPLTQSRYVVYVQSADGGTGFFYTSSRVHTSNPDLPILSLSSKAVTSGRPFTVHSIDGDQRWRVKAVRTQSGQAIFLVAASMRTADTTQQRLAALSFGVGLVAVAGASLLGWFAVRRAFRPLKRVERVAASITEGDLTRRIPETESPVEVRAMSDSLNSMLERIEASFQVRMESEQRMRRFAADASHELRTPLAAIRGYAELYRLGAVRDPDDVSGAMRRIEDEASRMGLLVEDLLTLTRLDSQRSSEHADVDLTVLAADAVQDAKALDATREVTLGGIDGPVVPTHVWGDELQLRQIFTNLISNALRHTPSGTPIEVLVGPDPQDDGWCVASVRDHGPGIDEADMAKVFERFYRTDPSRVRGKGGGTGLGLAIVAGLIEQHHGQVRVDTTPGGGATFTARFPHHHPDASVDGGEDAATPDEGSSSPTP